MNAREFLKRHHCLVLAGVDLASPDKLSCVERVREDEVEGTLAERPSAVCPPLDSAKAHSSFAMRATSAIDVPFSTKSHMRRTIMKRLVSGRI